MTLVTSIGDCFLLVAHCTFSGVSAAQFVLGIVSDELLYAKSATYGPWVAIYPNFPTSTFFTTSPSARLLAVTLRLRRVVPWPHEAEAMSAKGLTRSRTANDVGVLIFYKNGFPLEEKE